MTKYTCPCCGETFSTSLEMCAYKESQIAASGVNPFAARPGSEKTYIGFGGTEAYQVLAYRCYKCGQVSIDLHHFTQIKVGAVKPEEVIQVKPLGNERPIPKEVPQPIAGDYKEATRIMSLSLKGAATLARRCLQATLRNAFSEMPPGELFDEIEWVIRNGDLSEEINKALHALRKAGNFGAHPSEDGLTTIYELTLEDLESCFILLDTLFELVYVQPVRKKSRLNALTERIFPKKGPEA